MTKRLNCTEAIYLKKKCNLFFSFLCCLEALSHVDNEAECKICFQKTLEFIFTIINYVLFVNICVLTVNISVY